MWREGSSLWSQCLISTLIDKWCVTVDWVPHGEWKRCLETPKGEKLLPRRLNLLFLTGSMTLSKYSRFLAPQFLQAPISMTQMFHGKFSVSQTKLLLFFWSSPLQLEATLSIQLLESSLSTPPTSDLTAKPIAFTFKESQNLIHSLHYRHLFVDPYHGY